MLGITSCIQEWEQSPQDGWSPIMICLWLDLHLENKVRLEVYFTSGRVLTEKHFLEPGYSGIPSNSCFFRSDAIDWAHINSLSQNLGKISGQLAMLFVMLMTYQRSFLIESEVKYITSSVIGDDMMIPSGGRVTMIETYSYYQIFFWHDYSWSQTRL